MKKIILATMIVLISGGFAFADSSDPCMGPGVVHNSWLIDVNSNDEATRDGLLKTLDLLSTGGFTVSRIFAYSSSISSAKTFVVSFDPSYWSAGSARAKEIKEGMLKELAEVDGNVIQCNGIVGPAGGN